MDCRVYLVIIQSSAAYVEVIRIATNVCKGMINIGTGLSKHTYAKPAQMEDMEQVLEKVVLFFVQKVALMCVTKLMEHVYVNQTLPAKHVRPVNAESMEANVTQIVPEDV
ncbi:hypothetical protein DPMN_069403 [Dreissena polymorpha]|uniref:Uncharacterized protein n=1 Tax=Dreissena polymorpha TaxID=45954 RepID=A0A9D4BUY1_DREPO|nr:hypothetical protein DPMN_069403 [Dreissena polymorpha]